MRVYVSTRSSVLLLLLYDDDDDDDDVNKLYLPIKPAPENERSISFTIL